MDRRPLPPPAVAVDISSPSPSPRRPKKRQQLKLGGSGGPPPTLVVIDDDLTPQKADATRTPSFVAETPLSPGFAFDSDPSVVKCSLSRAKFGNASSDKFAGEFSSFFKLKTDFLGLVLPAVPCTGRLGVCLPGGGWGLIPIPLESAFPL